MGLFPLTGRDGNLPILTQIGALNADNHDEVLWWKEQRFYIALEKLHNPEADPHGKEGSLMLFEPIPGCGHIVSLGKDIEMPFFDNFEDRIKDEKFATEYNLFVSLIKTTQNIMRAWASHTDPDDEDLNRINEWLNHRPEVFSLAYSIGKVKGLHHRWDKWHPLAPAADAIFNAILEFYRDNKTAIRYCKSCGNPFLANVAKDQTYCSHRCSARESWRKGARKEKISVTA